MVWPQIAEKMQIQIWCGLEGIACGGVFSNKIAWVALLFWPQVYDSFCCGVLDGNTTGMTRYMLCGNCECINCLQVSYPHPPWPMKN